MSGRLVALLGSGEFGEWHADVDHWLLERAVGDGTVLVLPTASAAEGETVYAEWAAKGIAHYERLGIPVELLDVRTREDVDRRDVAERAATASMVFFSGGNPAYLARVLDGSALWSTIVGRLDRGLAFAGCSAGVACLTERTYDSDTTDTEDILQPGLGLIHGVQFGPHWDMLETWVPGARDMIVGLGGTTIGLDEDTAMVGDGTTWVVHGRQGIHLHADGAWSDHVAGDVFLHPLFAATIP